MMRKIYFILIVIAFAGVSLTNSRFAMAQEIRTALIDNALKGEGRVLVVAFKNGLPAEGVVMRTPVGDVITNSSGVVAFSMTEAPKQTLMILATNQVVEFSVTRDQETQITVNLLENENTQTQVANPIEDKQDKNVALAGPPQSVEVHVLSSNGAPIEQATILFSGIEKVYKTDSRGQISGMIPPGKYSVSVFHPNYQTYTVNQIEIGKESVRLDTIRLKEALNELEDVVVLAPKVRGSVSSLVEVRKQSSAVTDVLGSEQMARAGDTDAASSLRRVTGLTLVGGKYVYVRGLGERYSGVQMNSFSLPSPEPSRRVVPLDLFPTAIMESIVVQKSYSPDLPGEFGGGLIQLKTKSLPESFFFRANLTSNYENVNNRLNYKGGSLDWLGIDDGGRKLPAPIKNALDQGKQITQNVPGFDKGLSEAELTKLGQSLGNNYNTSRTDSPALPGFNFSLGSGWKLEGIKMGVASSALYGQSIDQFNRQSRAFNVGSGGKLDADYNRSTEVTEIETRLAGSIDLGFDIYKHSKFRLSSFLLRNTTNLIQTDLSQNFGSNGNFTDKTTLDFTERQLWTQHFKAEHDLQSIVNYPVFVDWRVGRSQATRNDPDRREYLYDIINNQKSIASGSAGNRSTWSTLGDTSTEVALNVSVPVFKDDPDFLKFKVGGLFLDKKRRSDIFRFFFDGTSPADPSAPPETILAPDNRIPGKLVLKNLTNSADSYAGTQTINAQYFMTDFSPWKKWSFQFGMRRESSVQEVNTFKYYEPQNPFATSRLKMNDILPAYSIVFKPTEKIRSRVAYSETLARPDFRELSTVGFIDDETGNSVQGNADLKGTVIKNIDHRWEYYFTPDEYASAGIFYKNFANPIEVMFLPGVNRIQTFDNAKAANNFGFEFEGRVGLRHFSRTFRRFTVLSNLTLIKSEIVLNDRNRGIQTSASRPLQGQSPYVINMQIQYDLPNKGFASTLLYNIVGKRITEVGTNDIPDTYEQPFGQLDFVASQVVQKKWTVSLRARNLLNPDIISTQGDEVVRSFRRGRVFSLNLGAVF